MLLSYRFGTLGDVTQVGASSTLARAAVRPSEARFVPGRAAVSVTVLGLLIGNAVVITWLWVGGGGISSVHSTGDAFTSIGRLTGLFAAYLALVEVVLLARVPWIERLVGFDRLTAWHRRNGHAVLWLVLAHVVAILIGYAALDKLSFPAEVQTMTTSYPGMVTAWVGTGLLIAVVVSSVVIVKRRLPYELWYAVHISAYAGIALAWFHQIPTGNELVLNTMVDDYWKSLYVATLALVVVFRLAAPVVGAFRYRLRVTEVVSEGPGVVSLRISGRNLDRLRARAGQFFLWRFLTPTHWWTAHPFSLSEAPDGRSLRITVKALGDHSAGLASIRPGTRVVTEGPFGVFTASAQRRDRTLLVAGGIGITPVRALLEEVRGDVAVVYRAVAEDDLVLRDELERVAADRGAALHYVVGDHTAPGGDRLLSTEHLAELVPDVRRREVFVCGPPAMTAAIERTVRKLHVPRRHVHVERFAL
jgi:predicted ferric reductase